MLQPRQGRPSFNTDAASATISSTIIRPVCRKEDKELGIMAAERLKSFASQILPNSSKSGINAM
jgi:hypothetical protein